MKAYAIPLMLAAIDWTVEDTQGFLISVGRFAFTDYSIAPELSRRIDYAWHAPFSRILPQCRIEREEGASVLRATLEETGLGQHPLTKAMPHLVVRMQERSAPGTSFADYSLDLIILKDACATRSLCLAVEDHGEGWRGYALRTGWLRSSGAEYWHDFTQPADMQIAGAALGILLRK